jgi:hypothetical protein
LPGVIEEPTGERAAQKEERKNQHEVRDALRHEPARQRPEEIANARVFAPGQEIEASEAADVNEGAPDGPPSACLRFSREKRCLAARTWRQSWLG